MLGNLIMIGGIGLLSVGFVLRRKQDYFKDLYNEIENSQKFHLDFVDQLDKLPTGKNLILFGPPKSQTSTEKVLCKSIIKRGSIQTQQKQGQQKKEFQFPKEDRLWKFALKEPFYLQTLSNEKISVEQDSNSQIYAFNLLRRNFNQLWQERVIVKNQPVCVYGKMSYVNGKMLMKPTLIMGTKNQSFLTFLDTQILKLRSKSKNFTIVGLGVFALHALYIQFFIKNRSSQQIISTVKAQKSPQQKILDEIKQFKEQKK